MNLLVFIKSPLLLLISFYLTSIVLWYVVKVMITLKLRGKYAVETNLLE